MTEEHYIIATLHTFCVDGFMKVIAFVNYVIDAFIGNSPWKEMAMGRKSMLLHLMPLG